MDKPQSDQAATENGNKLSAMYHTSEEYGLRIIHNPTRMEAVEHALKTVEISDFHNTENIKNLGEIVKALIDQNKFQQGLIDKLLKRVQTLEAGA